MLFSPQVRWVPFQSNVALVGGCPYHPPTNTAGGISWMTGPERIHKTARVLRRSFLQTWPCLFGLSVGDFFEGSPHVIICTFHVFPELNKRNLKHVHMNMISMSVDANDGLVPESQPTSIFKPQKTLWIQISYTFGLPPTQDASHKGRFRSGFPTKNASESWWFSWNPAFLGVVPKLGTQKLSQIGSNKILGTGYQTCCQTPPARSKQLHQRRGPTTGTFEGSQDDGRLFVKGAFDSNPWDFNPYSFYLLEVPVFLLGFEIFNCALFDDT